MTEGRKETDYSLYQRVAEYGMCHARYQVAEYLYQKAKAMSMPLDIDSMQNARKNSLANLVALILGFNQPLVYALLDRHFRGDDLRLPASMSMLSFFNDGEPKPEKIAMENVLRP